MLFTSVDVEALRYLRARGEVNAKFERELLENIRFGYQTELTYQDSSGCFSAFGGPDGSLWLTAFCLSIFSQTRNFVTVDERVLSRAAQWIMERQKPDGSWSPIGFVIHKELEGGLSGDFGQTAFVALALAEYGGPGTETALINARGYLEANLAGVENGHSLAMGACALSALKSQTAGGAVDKLLLKARTDPSGKTMFWEPVPVEATSYAVIACYEQRRLGPATAAAAWVAGKKDSTGGFGSTQDTVMALRALVKDAIESMGNTDIAFEILREGQVLNSSRIDGTNFSVVQTFDYEPGADITVRTSGSGPLCIQFAKLYNIPTDQLRSSGGLELSLSFGGTRSAVGDRVNAEARLLYRGSRTETNMTVAEIKIPTGLRPDRTALNEAVGKGPVRRIDAAKGSVVVYLDRLVNGEEVTIPIPLTAAFPAQPVPVASKAYDYYDPTITAIVESPSLVIGQVGVEVAFLRGDGNFDGAVDIADAIRALQYLFGGLGASPCPDALDVNDDGLADISDPIALLGYLFLSGTLPARPFPQVGEDPTPDELRCYIK